MSSGDECRTQAQNCKCTCMQEFPFPVALVPSPKCVVIKANTVLVVLIYFDIRDAAKACIFFFNQQKSKFPCRLSNDLHEAWNDSIAVLRTCAGEILGSVKIR